MRVRVTFCIVLCCGLSRAVLSASALHTLLYLSLLLGPFYGSSCSRGWIPAWTGDADGKAGGREGDVVGSYVSE